MLAVVILIALLLALLSGPSAFLLLWIMYNKTGEPSIRTLSFSMLGLCLILLGNGATIILDNFLRIHDARIAFLLMNGVFLATVMTGLFLCLFAHQSTATPLSMPRKLLFWVFTILFFFLVLSLPIFLNGKGEVNVDHGYLASTLYVTLCLAYAAVLVIGRRTSLLPMYRGMLAPLFGICLGLDIVSAANDVFHFGKLLGGPNFPFSPFFFLLINVSISVFCLKELLRTSESKRPTSDQSVLDFGLTEREKDILPLLLEGMSNEAIAEKLFISPHTVKNHVTSILRKANVSNRFELLKLTSAKS